MLNASDNVKTTLSLNPHIQKPRKRCIT